MKQITHLHARIKESIHPDSWQNIEMFFITFSRIEFALIETGKIKDEVFADWDAFAGMISTSFDPAVSDDLKKVCDYLLSHPPHIRKNNQWVPMPFRRGLNDIGKIIAAIKMVRNNLFHGGKYPYDPVRDDNLITACLIILDHCITLSPPDITNALWMGI